MDRPGLQFTQMCTFTQMFALRVLIVTQSDIPEGLEVLGLELL